SGNWGQYSMPRQLLLAVTMAITLAAGPGITPGFHHRLQAAQGDSARNAGGPCDRACLEGFVDQFLDGFVNHDPKLLPLSRNARYTENGQRLELGDGSWR